MIQAAAVQAIGQSIVHRNATPANQLVDAMHHGLRKDSLVKFLEVHGCLAWIKGEKKFAFFEVKDAKFDSAIKDELMKSPWSRAVKAPEVKSIYDVEEALERFLKSCESAIKSGKTMKHSELYDEVKLTMARYFAGEFEEPTVQ